MSVNHWMHSHTCLHHITLHENGPQRCICLESWCSCDRIYVQGPHNHHLDCLHHLHLQCHLIQPSWSHATFDRWMTEMKQQCYLPVGGPVHLECHPGTGLCLSTFCWESRLSELAVTDCLLCNRLPSCTQSGHGLSMNVHDGKFLHFAPSIDMTQ